MSTYIANIINLKKLKRFYNLEQSDRSSFQAKIKSEMCGHYFRTRSIIIVGFSRCMVVYS
jgi:hypothetical protein